MLLVASVSSTGFALYAKSGNVVSVPVSEHVSLADQQLLIDARQALINYSTLYPYLYGPRGAGPGHLPCPDTDGGAVDSVTSLNAEKRSVHGSDHSISRITERNFAGDGPNPPCGRTSVSIGKLPRHVRLADQRYTFHTASSQLASYSVSSDFINNPVNRIVNPSMLYPNIRKEAAATISLPSGTLHRSAATVELSHESLLAVALPSVAAWIINKSKNLSYDWCSGQTQNSEFDTTIDNPATVQAVENCPAYKTLLERCPQDGALLLAVDRLPETGECAGSDYASLSIDGVPASRHWFVRNQWPRWVEISADQFCGPEIRNTVGEVCELRFLRPDNPLLHQHLELPPVVNLIWQRQASGSE
jgi:hypothetical protein